jgi:hypothetical protein
MLEELNNAQKILQPLYGVNNLLLQFACEIISNIVYFNMGRQRFLKKIKIQIKI